MTQTSDLWPGGFYKMRETLPAEDRALLADLAGVVVPEFTVARDVRIRQRRRPKR